jgi:hypothetical protein
MQSDGAPTPSPSPTLVTDEEQPIPECLKEHFNQRLQSLMEEYVRLAARPENCRTEDGDDDDVVEKPTWKYKWHKLQGGLISERPGNIFSSGPIFSWGDDGPSRMPIADEDLEGRKEEVRRGWKAVEQAVQGTYAKDSDLYLSALLGLIEPDESELPEGSKLRKLNKK